MRVFEVMTEGVRTVPPSLPATEGWEVMRTEGIHHLVVTLDKRVVGVLSDRDAGGPRGAQLRAGAAVGDRMTRDVVTVQTSDTVGRAANLMRGRTIGCVPVTDGKKLVGIVTTADLTDHAAGFSAPSGKSRALITSPRRDRQARARRCGKVLPTSCRARALLGRGHEQFD